MDTVTEIHPESRPWPQMISMTNNVRALSLVLRDDVDRAPIDRTARKVHQNYYGQSKCIGASCLSNSGHISTRAVRSPVGERIGAVYLLLF
jgi:hypothetical protein